MMTIISAKDAQDEFEVVESEQFIDPLFDTEEWLADILISSAKSRLAASTTTDKPKGGVIYA